MRYITLICARGGSKGVKNKNIKNISGHPLIAWTISIGKKIRKSKKIIISTDSLKIKKISEKYGAEVPYIRPNHLAKDNSPEWKVWKHAVNFIEKKNKINFDALIILPATSPLRSMKDINKAITKFEKTKSDAIISITHSSRNPYFNMVKLDKYGFAEIINKMSKNIYNRQSAPKTFDMTTVIYIVNKEFLKSAKNLFEGKINHVMIPQERAIDIDTKLDFEIAELLMKKNNYKI